MAEAETKRVRLPNSCQVDVGSDRITLLSAIAEIPVGGADRIAETLGGALIDAEWPPPVAPAVPMEYPGNMSADVFEEAQRLGLAQQLVALFFSGRVHQHGRRTSADDDEPWKRTREDDPGPVLSDAERQLYEACLKTLTKFLEKPMKKENV